MVTQVAVILIQGESRVQRSLAGPVSKIIPSPSCILMFYNIMVLTSLCLFQVDNINNNNNESEMFTFSLTSRPRSFSLGVLGEGGGGEERERERERGIEDKERCVY